MGIYLNGKKAFGVFQEDVAFTYYVDKTDILDELVPILELKNSRTRQEKTGRGKGLKYICITRPRRFGKTMIANMIASYLGKGVDMTGILPMSKYSSGSELNMFFEFSMVTMEKYSEYFGFTDEEVDALYQRYIKLEENPKVSRNDLRLWYNGYQTKSGRRLYNPRSVVGALEYNQIGSYWTNSGPYDEIYYYVKNDTANMREDIALMMSGTPVPANVQEYASVSMELKTKDEIFSAMVVYGFLSYADGCVSITNKELMDKFAEMVRKRPDFGYIYRLAAESGKMLTATKKGDIDTMVEILERCCENV